MSDELIVYFKIYVFNSTGCWFGAVSNALQRIWEDRIWKLVPKAGYPGAREIPISIVPSLEISESEFDPQKFKILPSAAHHSGCAR